MFQVTDAALRSHVPHRLSTLWCSDCRFLSQSLLFSSDPTTVIDERFYNPQTGQSEAWCKSWLNSFLRVQSLTYGSALIVVAVNLVFRRLLKPVVRFEHEWYVYAMECGAGCSLHVLGPILVVCSLCCSPPAILHGTTTGRSKTGEVLSRATKLFFLQFTNTAILVLLINAQVETRWAFLKQGQYTDFTTFWYLSVGVSITLTMVAYVFTPHISPILMMLSRRFRYVSPHVDDDMSAVRMQVPRSSWMSMAELLVLARPMVVVALLRLSFALIDYDLAGGSGIGVARTTCELDI